MTHGLNGGISALSYDRLDGTSLILIALHADHDSAGKHLYGSGMMSDQNAI
jgi:hypothetical protein